MKYQTYPAYKDSGVEWLGEVPEHWDVIQIKHLTAVQRGASPRPIDDPKYFDDEGEYAWVRIADVSSSNGVLRETTQRLSNLGNSLSVKIHSGELFISIAGTVGKPCISAIKACIHDGFVYFPTLKIPPIFLYRIFEAGLCYGGLGKLGTQLNLNTETIGAIRVALPNAKELEQVLNFLDHETAKIDTLIEKQRRLIELLKEKRQAVISHAVTKGLNPNAPMKDSGVEWLGEVPEHWIFGRYKFCTTRIVVGIAEAATHAYVDVGIPIIRSTNIREEGLDTEGMLFINETFAGQNSSKYLYANDVITVRTGYPGISAVIPEFLNKSQCFTNLVATPCKNISPNFLAEYLNSHTGKSYFDLLGWGSAQKNISVPILQNIPIAYPTENEQLSIVEFVKEQRDKFTDLINKSNQFIELMQERRTALISAAVTGKIDVREWNAANA